MNTTLHRLLPLAAIVALAACGQGTGTTDAGGEGDADAVAEDTVYTGSITVYQGVERDSAELCAVVAESYPPQCAGLPVTGWDWEAVEHEEASGVRWGTFVVTGTFDGKAFTVTGDPLTMDEIDLADHPELQYTEPEIGDPAEDLGAAELEAFGTELAEQFPSLVFGSFPDEASGVLVTDVLLVSPELEAYAAEHFPEDAVAFAPVLRPVEE
ncbi:hypothetical protein SAMN05216298_1939 [Glycomyces sambucus]|uniref:Uncharacterized protein n=1 Tax=Glycomyces sambucus TaxID=380244 RepID=A0A1G9FQ47_9ACTN|nr:hypothetical protein [Glycomyces sambucus]SDK90253.1 hypothetical protein SAMN05216298_1939 [Glycomyces sambucus]